MSDGGYELSKEDAEAIWAWIASGGKPIIMNITLAPTDERERAFEVWFASMHYPVDQKPQFWMTWMTALCWNERGGW
jgi:hypothetical protein